jgi:hypothetical protein
MQWLEKARAVFHGHGLPLPDPDRIDVGSVPDTALLIKAIDVAMPRTAVLQLIGPRHKALLPILASRSLATRHSSGEYFLSLDDGSVTELARAASSCTPDEVCSHLFVQEGDHTLLEAFGRDRGEDVVWLSRRVPRSSLQRFLEVIAGTPQSVSVRGRVGIVRQPARVLLLR